MSRFIGVYTEFRNQLIITSSMFTEDYWNEEKSNRLNLIYKLYERGFSNREITDYLILMGIKTKYKKRNYTITDVWLCLNKLKKRKKRLSDLECVLGEWIVWDYN